LYAICHVNYPEFSKQNDECIPEEERKNMCRDYKLVETDLLKNNHFPIMAFFNAIPNVDFLDVIKQFSFGIGGGFTDAVCTFPGDLDSDETSFDGVMFSLHDEEIIVDNETFLYYLEKACLVFVEDFQMERVLLILF